MKSIWNKILIYGTLLVLIFGVILFAIGYRNLQVQPCKEPYFTEEPKAISVGLEEGIMVSQTYINHADNMKGVSLRFTNYGKDFKEGRVYVELRDKKEKVLASASLAANEIPDNQDVYFSFGEGTDVKKNEKITFCIYSTAEEGDESLALWMTEAKADCILQWNGETQDNIVYMIPDGYTDAHFLVRYIIFIASVFFAFLGFCYVGISHDKKGILTSSNEIIHIFDKYTFLLHQLVGRDFAVKYRRSYLGLVWVILNPLLTMIVMSTVFSYIFRFQIQNYAVYLILGNITFNCFSEITQLCTQSIVGNGQIIKKVYIPKYIFPFSKSLFAFFNFLLTLIPAFAVVIYNRVPITVNYLLLPIVLAGLFMFALGIGFFLSALQVFMRDTQYLYTIILTLWTYLTPIFYSEELLSPLLLKIMQLNPMYIYISSIRKIMLYGTTPTLYQLMACLWMGIIALFIGVRYFFHKQRKFILHI